MAIGALMNCAVRVGVVRGIGHHHPLGGRAIGDDGARQDSAGAG